MVRVVLIIFLLLSFSTRPTYERKQLTIFINFNTQL